MQASGLAFGCTMLAAVAMAAMLACDAPAAGGAFAVDDAAVDEPGACKIESSASFGSNRDFIGFVTPACVVSLFRPAEIGVNVVRTLQDGEWGTSLVPKAKMNILPADTGKLGLAIAGGSAFDVLTGEYTGSFVNVPVTYTLSETFKANFNGGWLYEHRKNQHFLTYGVGVEWIPMKPFTLIAEVFGLAGRQGDTRGVTEPRFQVGIRITPIDTIDFDVIYGRNIAAENANWLTIGMNVRFPVPK
jgi:hypothetical protein